MAGRPLHITDMVVYRRIEFVRTGWGSRIGGVVALALGLGLAAALLLLSVGIALVLLPVVVVALLVGRWRWRKLVAEAEARAAERDDRVIEIDYEVIEKANDGGPEVHRRP